MVSAAPALAFDRVGIEFPGVQALQDVSFGVAAGSIHALLGENGAGKSTLLKILSGAYPPSSGSLVIDGRQRSFHHTAEAIAAGISVIYQELHLVPKMSVAENLFLGHRPQRLGVVNRRELDAAARRILASIGEDIAPATKVDHLTLAQRQMVEIAKALTRGTRIIAFDEPTSSLSEREVQRLFTIMRDLKARGCALVYVSHRLDEIFALCDRVTVLRDGRHVETADVHRVTRATLVRRMVGRELADVFAYAPRPRVGAGLAVTGLRGFRLRPPCTFAAAAGVILGVFGLVGAGRTELLRLIFGADASLGGRITVQGVEVTIGSPRDAIAAGIVLCPEDRKKEGIVPVRSVLENINLSAHRRHARPGGLIAEEWEQTNAQQQVGQLSVRTPSLRQPIRHLSAATSKRSSWDAGCPSQ